MNPQQDNGIVSVTGSHNVEDTVAKIEAIL